MAVIIDPLLCMIFSGVMFFCSGFASYGCYRCFTDNIDGSKVVPEGNEKGFLKRSKERYRLKLFRRRPSTASSDATIYSVHSSEIWSRRASPSSGAFIKSPSPDSFVQSALLRASPRSFITPTQIRGWTIKEEPEEENENRRNSAPV